MAWVPLPDVPEVSRLRHTWILVRNAGPRNPTFHSAPQPRHVAGEEDRNALILMTYFRPYTLWEQAWEEVCHARDLRLKDETWAQAMQKWITTGVTCEEAKRYILNYMNVVDLRPMEDADGHKHAHDLFSDEEFDPQKVEPSSRHRTHVGGIGEENEERKAPSTRRASQSQRPPGFCVGICARPARVPYEADIPVRALSIPGAGFSPCNPP